MSMHVTPVEVFYSYADADALLLHTLEQHLSLLQHEGLITTRHKRQIPPGTDWQAALEQQISTASVILLLISPDFLASDHCYGVEMQRAIQLYEANNSTIIPILLRPVDWQKAPFARFTVLPQNKKPVTSWNNQDEAFLDIVQNIRTVLRERYHHKEELLVTNVHSLPLREHHGIHKHNDNDGLSALKERFTGSTGQRLLIDALKMQKLVVGNATLAEELADLVAVRAVKTGETIIRQGASDNDLFFILAGSFSILVNGKFIARRCTNDHVGEISAIEPSLPRTATVVADEASVVCQLSEAQLADVGHRHPDIWRYFCKELARRLAQRNTLIPPT